MKITWANGSLWDMTGRATITTFIGAGGKTTCLQTLAQEISSYGLQVIATTTTKVFPEQQMNGWRSPYSPPYPQEGACFWYVESEDRYGKWIGPSVVAVDAAIHEDLQLERKGRFWVIEGDGARGLRLKCWGPNEPQIPRRSDCVVLVLDGNLWGEVLQADQVHRPERCPDLWGHVWHAERAWDYFLRSPIFAREYMQMSWVILLNRSGEDIENQNVLARSDSLHPLKALSQRWTEINGTAENPGNRPRHLRLVVGDAKEGKLQWCDLW